LMLYRPPSRSSSSSHLGVNMWVWTSITGMAGVSCYCLWIAGAPARQPL
jgi:hypothetical protein